MKHFIFQAAKLTAIVLALFGMFGIASCGDDDDDPILVVEDGFYIQGDATAYTDFRNKATMASTRNEVNQADRAQLLEIFVAIKGTGGFNIIEVAGATRNTYGPGAGFATDTEGTTDEPKVAFQRGAAEVTTTNFTVPGDGLYHVVMDTEVGVVAIVPVQYWGLIGGATPNGWSGDTPMTSDGFDLNTMTFRAANVPMTIGDFKFRYSGGWKVEIDNEFVGPDFTGIKVNSNFGGSVADLVPGGDNIGNTVSGFYTAVMTWTDGSGFAATMTKTGDLPRTDWTDVELGLVGAGLSDTGVPHNWDVTLYVQKPSKAGTVYTYSYPGIEVNTGGGGFKIREGQDWSGTVLGYPQVTMTGDGADDFETNGDGNFIPKVEGGKYNMTLSIDAATEVYTVNMTKI